MLIHAECATAEQREAAHEVIVTWYRGSQTYGVGHVVVDDTGLAEMVAFSMREAKKHQCCRVLIDVATPWCNCKA